MANEINELADLVWEYGDACISESEGSECASSGPWNTIEEKIGAIKREMNSKDAKIAKLQEELHENKTLAGSMLIGRDAIIKELAEGLEWCNKQAESIGKASLTGGLQMDALTMTMAGMSRRCIKLVAKAREILSDTQVKENGNDGIRDI